MKRSFKALIIVIILIIIFLFYLDKIPLYSSSEGIQGCWKYEGMMYGQDVYAKITYKDDGMMIQEVLGEINIFSYEIIDNKSVSLKWDDKERIVYYERIGGKYLKYDDGMEKTFTKCGLKDFFQ